MFIGTYSLLDTFGHFIYIKHKNISSIRKEPEILISSVQVSKSEKMSIAGGGAQVSENKGEKVQFVTRFVDNLKRG